MFPFVGTVFALTFALQLTGIFLLSGPLQLLVVALGSLAPGIVAMLWGGRAVFRRTHDGSPGLAALGAIAVPLLVGAAASGGTLRELSPDPTSIFLVTLTPFFEELAWRGFLQKRALPAAPSRLEVGLTALAIGVVWGLWHLPMSLDNLAAFPRFVLGTAVASVWIGALYELGGRRIWVAMLAHAVINLRVFDSDSGNGWLGLAVSAALAGGTLLLVPQRQEVDAGDAL
jgi:membrane protease YdiL (CAAX protease family)